MHFVRYRQAHEALMAMPPSLPQDFKPDVAAARAVVEGALRGGRLSGNSRKLLIALHGDSDAQTTTTIATRLVARADARLPHMQGHGMDADLLLRRGPQ
jgi:hypothetical protein